MTRQWFTTGDDDPANGPRMMTYGCLTGVLFYAVIALVVIALT